jgi:hypothetical protein
MLYQQCRARKAVCSIADTHLCAAHQVRLDTLSPMRASAPSAAAEPCSRKCASTHTEAAGNTRPPTLAVQYACTPWTTVGCCLMGVERAHF